MTGLSQERLKELFIYDPVTGIFIRKSGKVAGYDKEGYRQIQIDNKSYYVHRLAFLYMEGVFPKEDVDHLDKNPSNNAWANLRACSTKQNMQNKKLYKNNKTGLPGIYWIARRAEWVAEISGKQIGYFKAHLDAISARKSYELKNGFADSHGRIFR